MPYANTIQFVFAPMNNPDGYEYSRKSRSTRLWRQNRCELFSLLSRSFLRVPHPVRMPRWA